MITIHRDKFGKWEFGVSSAIMHLSVDDMNELRAMTMCAIGSAEEMFRMGIMKRADIKEAQEK
jgi:hypothetical protein